MNNMNRDASQTEKQTPRALLSSDPDRAIQEMMDTIDELRVIYERETEALENADTPRFFELQDQKMNFAQKYQTGMGEMIERREEMKNSLSHDMKRKLEKKQKEFSALTQKNLDALSRMNRCVERLGDILCNAAKESAKKDNAFNYNQSGHMELNHERPVSTGISETA